MTLQKKKAEAEQKLLFEIFQERESTKIMSRRKKMNLIFFSYHQQKKNASE